MNVEQKAFECLCNIDFKQTNITFSSSIRYHFSTHGQHFCFSYDHGPCVPKWKVLLLRQDRSPLFLGRINMPSPYGKSLQLFLQQLFDPERQRLLEAYRHAIAGIAYMVDASARKAVFRKDFIRIDLPGRTETLFLSPTEAIILQDLLEHTARFSNNGFGVGGSISIDIGQTGHEQINDIGWASKLLPKTYQDML